MTQFNLHTQNAIKDATFFNSQQLPFYSIKPLYIGLVYISYKAGFSLTKATLIPSFISFVCITILFFLWMELHISSSVTFIAGILLIISPPMMSLGKLSTPDVLCTLSILAGFYFLIEKESMWGLSFFFLALFIRIDAILFLIMLLSLLKLSKVSIIKLSEKKYFFLISLSIFCYLLIGIMTGNYIFKSLFLSYYTEWSVDPAYNISLLKITTDYLERIKGAILSLEYSNVSLVLLLVVIALSGFRWNNFIKNFNLQLILLIVVNIIARFIIYPWVDDRFFAPHYILFFILILRVIQEQSPYLRKKPIKTNKQLF